MLTNISNYLQNKFLARTRNKLMMNWSSESLMIQERRKREQKTKIVFKILPNRVNSLSL